MIFQNLFVTDIFCKILNIRYSSETANYYFKFAHLGPYYLFLLSSHRLIFGEPYFGGKL